MAVPAVANAQITRSSLQDQEPLEELCEDVQASVVLLRTWARCEEEVLDAECKCTAFVPKPGVRQLVAGWLAGLLRAQLVPQDVPMKALRLLDAWCAVGGDTCCLRLVPAMCVAVCSVLQKLHPDATMAIHREFLDYLLEIVQDLPCRLQEACGGEAIEWEPVTAESVALQEEGLVKAMRWRVELPSVESWIGALAKRFQIFAAEVPQASTALITFVHQSSAQHAGALAMWPVPNQPCRPQQLANGLFGLRLVAAGLVPLQSLRPEEICEDEWEFLFESGPAAAAAPAFALGPEAAQRVLAAFEAAADSDLDVLKEDCRLAASLLRVACICARGAGVGACRG